MVSTNRKIIYLGFQKCGTTSFWRYFGAHGFRAIHNTIQVCNSIKLAPDSKNGEKLHNIIDYDLLDRFVENYTVLTDNPFPLLYEYFDKSFMEAQFVLGTRPIDDWLASMQRYFGRRMPALGNVIYSSDSNPIDDPESFRKTYENHNAAVRQYFDRRSNFLEIGLGSDSNETITRKLEDFLDLPRNTKIQFERHLPR